MEYGAATVWVKGGMEMMEKIVNVDTRCNIGFKPVEPVDGVREFSKVGRRAMGIWIANKLASFIIA